MSVALTTLALTGLFVGAMSSESESSVTPIFRLDDTRQEIEHFGASDCWTFQTLGEWSEENKNRLADLLFSTEKGIGLSIWRFNIGAGINPQIARPERTAETLEVSEGVYDMSRQNTEQWFLGAAKKRGVPNFLAFVNSPPARMTRNGLTFGAKGSDTTNLKPGYEGQFAQYLVDILDNFRKHPDRSRRIEFDYISPLNEPQWAWEDNKQEGTRMSNPDIKRVASALAAELQKRRLRTKISLVEGANLPHMVAPYEGATKQWGAPYGDYIDEFFGDPEMERLMSDRIGYHSYFSDLIGGDILNHRRALRRKMDEYPGKKIWQTEYCILQGPTGKGGGGRDLTMETALHVARIMHIDLTVADVSAWHWWLALSTYDFKDGLLYTDYQKKGDPQNVLTSKTFWSFGNYSRFVRPGMKRIEVSDAPQELRGLMGSAYIDEKAKKVVSVWVNASSEDRVVFPKVEMGRRKWKLASLTRHLTSDTPGDDLRAETVSDPSEGLKVPARSVATFVHRFRS